VDRRVVRLADHLLIRRVVRRACLLEDGAGADEGDQVQCVTGIPSWSKAVRDGERRVVGATFVDPTHW
jgi:hypothetical protein